ncbi:hypothetical protein P7C71_g1042, partial [Lecanoromycetidae sp. Uapishka_2]
MAPALSTTKRKFYKILDSISNASDISLASTLKHNASTTTLTSTFESPAKRTKLDRPISAYVAPSKRLSALSTPSNRAATVAVNSLGTMNTAMEPPNFSPADREQFLKRLKTFSDVYKWKTKSDKINEVQWARRGWSCVGVETVACVGVCERRLVISLEDTAADKGHQQEQTAEERLDEEERKEKAKEDLEEKYVALITRAHEEGCPWHTFTLSSHAIYYGLWTSNSSPDNLSPCDTYGTFTTATEPVWQLPAILQFNLKDSAAPSATVH